MTMREMRSLFLVSILVSSVTEGMVSTRLWRRASEDRFGPELMPVAGLDDTTLGDRDNGLLWIGTPDVVLVDRRCFNDGIRDSVPLAATAETPSPPLRRALLRRLLAWSKASAAFLRLRTGGLLTVSVCGTEGARKTASFST